MGACADAARLIRISRTHDRPVRRSIAGRFLFLDDQDIVDIVAYLKLLK